MKLKRFISILLCAALALSCAACSFSSPENVLTINGENVPAGLYLLCQYQAFQNAKSLREDTSVPVLDCEIEGKTAEAWIYDETVESLSRYVWIDQTFEASGLSLTDEQLSSIDSVVDQVWAVNGDLLTKNGVGLETYRRAVTLSEKYSTLMNDYLDSDEGKVSEQDAKDYMKEKYIRVDVLMMPTSDADYTALGDEDVEKINARANELADALNRGGDMDDLAEEALKDVFEICGREFTDTTMDLYRSNTFLSMQSTGYTEEFLQSLFDLGEGKALFYDEGMPMVFCRVPHFKDDAEFRDDYYEAASQEIASNAFVENVNTTIEAYEVTQIGSAVKTYAPKKIVE